MSKTNLERFREMDAAEFWRAVTDAYVDPLHAYINYPEWLKGTSEKLSDYIQFIGTGLVKPSDESVERFEKSRTGHGLKTREIDIEAYVQINTKRVLILEKTVIFGEIYYAVFDIIDKEIRKVPAKNIIFDEYSEKV